MYAVLQFTSQNNFMGRSQNLFHVLDRCVCFLQYPKVPLPLPLPSIYLKTLQKDIKKIGTTGSEAAVST